MAAARARKRRALAAMKASRVRESKLRRQRPHEITRLSWSRVLTDAEMAAVTSNPWQLFA